MGSRMVGLGRGGAGGVVQFFDKVVDVLVVALGTFVVAVQLLDKALTCPLLFGVKGVGDVLAGRGAGCFADAVLLWDFWRCVWRWGG